MTLFRIGFLPLVDAVLPIVAHEFGLAATEGVSIELVGDSSWATVRDRLIYGQTDAAHLLAPLAIATSLGLDRPAVPMAAPFMLGLSGNAVTVSPRIAARLGDRAIGDVKGTDLALVELAREEAAAGRKLRFAVVHRYSSHNYMLRYWLAASGCDLGKHVEIVVVAPPFVADALGSGEIDGSCVGEPWSSVAVERGVGVMVAATARIWSRGVEKLLAFRRSTLEQRRPEVEALIRRPRRRPRGRRSRPAGRDCRPACPASLCRPAGGFDRTRAFGPHGAGQRTGTRADRGFPGPAPRGCQLPVAQPGDVALFADGALGPRHLCIRRL